jgi:parvulin-like peptidyl-prolyl isomerase
LAEACIRRHGEEVLEGTINRRILEQALRQRKLTVTEEDLDQEIARAASQKLPLQADGSPDVEKWIAAVTEQQNISVDVYRSDAVWPSVAVKKLVGQTVEVTEEDLRKGFEANFGPRVRCQAIVLDDLRRAQKVWDLARSDPTRENFGDLAAQYSIEPSSRALRGEVPPIQKYGGQPALEEAAFALKPGELSQIIQIAGTNTYVILLCEGLTEPVHVDFDAVRDEIHADLHERKLHVAMADYFEKLQQNATIDNYLAGSVQRPRKSEAPGGAPQGPAPRQATPKR